MLCCDCGYQFRKGDRYESFSGADSVTLTVEDPDHVRFGEVRCVNAANCRKRHRSGKHSINLAKTETDVEVMLTAIADRLREECVRAVIEPALESEERLRYIYGKAISGQALMRAYW